MERFAIKYVEETRTCRCPLCDQPGLYKKGPQIFLGEVEEPLCRPCGKRLAGNLTALLDLAHVADKAGRQCRYLLTPPMETMLELSRAAENYTHAAPKVRVAAG